MAALAFPFLGVLAPCNLVLELASGAEATEGLFPASPETGFLKGKE